MLNAVFNVNKPRGMTSNDVVVVMRKILNMKKVGHGGTLDPDACGVLPVFTGTAARLLEFAVNGRKEYVATFILGMRTSTGDLSGTVVMTGAVPDLTDEMIKKVLQKFIGSQEQIPPMYSALKVNGKKLYQLARRGETVERQPRRIEIFNLELLNWSFPEFTIRVECTKGTYIRVLGEDLAAALGTVGTMSSLLRTRVGDFTLDNSFTLAQIDQNPPGCALRPLDIIPLPKLQVTARQAYRLTSGVATTIRGTKDGRYAALAPEGSFIAIVFADGEIVKAEKVLERYDSPE